MDEVSFIGRAFLAKWDARLRQGRRAFFSRNGIDPDTADFGGLSIVLVGDFGQLEPIDDWSIVDTESTYADCPARLRHLWGHQRAGLRKLASFQEAFVLRRVHRSAEDLEWTESCLRLRDATCTKEGDYDWWRQHDLDRGHLTPEQISYFEEEAVWLCARCEDVGARNGRKLAQMAVDRREVIHQIRAQNSTRSARKQGAAAFEGLRDIVNLVRGCKVMLTRNVAYRYGLANGSRGQLVGIVYGAGGIGTFPEAVIVDMPSYEGRGPALYPGQPTWVPILPMTSRKEGTKMTRTQFPLVAGFALTVNKAQGLTMPEGVVINLAGSARFRPAAKHGLPFVAFTRSESFAMTAFKNLPPWSDFRKAKESAMLRMRNAFAAQLDGWHRQTLARHSGMAGPREEEQAQLRWSVDRSRRPKRRRMGPPRVRCPACDAARI